MHKPDDIVRIRHLYYAKRAWLIQRSFPSLKEGVLLHRVVLLRSDKTPSRISVVVSDEQITHNLGGYEQWLQPNRSLNR